MYNSVCEGKLVLATSIKNVELVVQFVIYKLSINDKNEFLALNLHDIFQKGDFDIV